MHQCCHSNHIFGRIYDVAKHTAILSSFGEIPSEKTLSMNIYKEFEMYFCVNARELKIH